jgi:hypothetical protein
MLLGQAHPSRSIYPADLKVHHLRRISRMSREALPSYGRAVELGAAMDVEARMGRRELRPSSPPSAEGRVVVPRRQQELFFSLPR